MKRNVYYNGKIYFDCDLKIPESFTKYPEPTSDDQLQFDWLISSFRSCPYIGNNLKDGEVVVENVDYELYPSCSNNHALEFSPKLKAFPK